MSNIHTRFFVCFFAKQQSKKMGKSIRKKFSVQSFNSSIESKYCVVCGRRNKVELNCRWNFGFLVIFNQSIISDEHQCFMHFSSTVNLLIILYQFFQHMKEFSVFSLCHRHTDISAATSNT